MAEEMLEFTASHGVRFVAMIGCPHQEGIDYQGQWCPILASSSTSWHSR
jgi:hypothetical protein